MMKKIACIALVALAGSAYAQLGPEPGSEFYGGDPSALNGFSDEYNTNVSDSYFFDDFKHNGGNIVALYGDWVSDFDGSLVTGYQYEIRSGMGAGDGGTLVASGDTDGTWTYTNFPPGYFGRNSYRLYADIADITLPAGTYHMALRPKGSGSGFGQAFVLATLGTNSVGDPIGNGNGYFHSGYFGYNYEPADNVFGAGPWDAGYGVVVPAPSALALIGLGGLVAVRRRR
jgi:hypothetical protein